VRRRLWLFLLAPAFTVTGCGATSTVSPPTTAPAIGSTVKSACANVMAYVETISGSAKNRHEPGDVHKVQVRLLSDLMLQSPIVHDGELATEIRSFVPLAAGVHGGAFALAVEGLERTCRSLDFPVT
jgi:hypothetical protein